MLCGRSSGGVYVVCRQEIVCCCRVALCVLYVTCTPPHTAHLLVHFRSCAFCECGMLAWVKPACRQRVHHGYDALRKLLADGHLAAWAPVGIRVEWEDHCKAIAAAWVADDVKVVRCWWGLCTSCGVQRGCTVLADCHVPHPERETVSCDLAHQSSASAPSSPQQHGIGR